MVTKTEPCAVTVVHPRTGYYVIRVTDHRDLFPYRTHQRLRLSKQSSDFHNAYREDPTLTFSFEPYGSAEEAMVAARNRLVNAANDPLCKNEDKGYSGRCAFKYIHGPDGRFYAGYATAFNIKRRVIEAALEDGDHPVRALLETWKADPVCWHWEILPVAVDRSKQEGYTESYRRCISEAEAWLKDPLCLNGGSFDGISTGTFVQKRRADARVNATIARWEKATVTDRKATATQFSKPVLIEGVLYPSASEANRQLNVSSLSAVFKHLRSKDPRWKRWYCVHDTAKRALDDGKPFCEKDYPGHYSPSKGSSRITYATTPVIVNRKRYGSLTEAAKALGLDRRTVCKRALSKDEEWSGWHLENPARHAEFVKHERWGDLSVKWKGGGSLTARPFVANGVTYPAVTVAAEACGLNQRTLRDYAKDPDKQKDYHYASDQE